METGKEVVKISLTNIIPNRFQPRISFDEEALNELANSIKMYGILQPLILRPLGDKYEIIAGERRYKAATIAGLSEVPAILVNLDDQTSAELAIIENIQRKDLTAIEEAKSYKKLLDLGNYTQDQLAVKMGKSQATIANKLRLLNLLPETQDALMNNLISERHARSLLQLKDDTSKQREVLNRIINERLTVKATDELIKSMMGGNEMNDNILTTNTSNELPNINIANNIQPEQPININSFNAENINSNQVIPPVNEPIPTMENNMPSVETNNSIPELNTPVNNLTNDFNIPTLNTDTFNLSEISDPNLNIPTTPINNNIPSFDLNSNLNSQPEQTNNINVTPSTDFSTPNFDSLLQVEEQKNDEPIVEIPQPHFEPSSAPTNKYFPDLEKETVNMNFANPYNVSTTPVETPTANNITTAINETREMVTKLESLGYKVTTEELDQPDNYQITIKIKKETAPM